MTYRFLPAMMLALATHVAYGTAAPTDVVDAIKAALPMPVTPAPSTAKSWRIHAGSTLRKTLTEWADAATYKVVWHAKHGFNIEADARFSGEFLTALQSLFEAYETSEKPLYVDVYPDQRLVVVSSATDTAP